MEEKYFLEQIKHTGTTWEKGVVVKGYGKDANTDYVQCNITDMSGRIRDSIVDDRIPRPEPTPEPEEV